jgi:6-phosphogluconate dehydrogenase (decarboxylating)/phosphoglycolate phosphatase-like HAD superfamily hydrolase
MQLGMIGLGRMGSMSVRAAASSGSNEASASCGGENETVGYLDPIFRTLAPGVAAAPRTNEDAGTPSTAEHGYLHCGAAGAGHFVKMVHNGIEYGIMAAYAEGLNVLHKANVGKEEQEFSAEQTPLPERDYYRYDIDVAQVAEVRRRGSVVASWLLDLTAAALKKSPTLEEFGGRVSDSGEGRWTIVATIDEGVPVPVLSASLSSASVRVAKRTLPISSFPRCGSSSAGTRSSKDAEMGSVAASFSTHAAPPPRGRTMEQPLAILFDIDGTLITTGGAGTVAWRLAFEDLYGIPADIGKYTDAGMTDPEVGRLTFRRVIGRDPSPEEMAALITKRTSRLPQAVAESKGYKVLDGVPEALERLSRAGVLLGLTTGGVEAAARIKLARADLNRYFCFGGYGSDSSDRAELTRKAIERAGTILGGPVDPQRVLVVGDTPLDIEAARAAGALGVGVASGQFDEKALRAAGADYVLGSLREQLPGVAEAMS